MRWSTVDSVLNQDFPSVTGLLESVQVKCDQIIEKVAFNLTTEDVELAPKNIESMSVSTGRPRTGRKGARPLFRCYFLSVLRSFFKRQGSHMC